MPIITIFGATGTQGSSVLTAILADGKYTPRAVSRNVDSDASKALSAKGVEVVAANLFDKASIVKAIQGSEVVFGTTNFWDPEVFPADMSGKGEIVQGKNLVDAVKEVGIKFFIWSSLPSAMKESNGLYTHVHHFENKNKIDEYLAASGVPHVVLLTAWFAENLWKLGSLQKTDTGYTLPIPKYGPADKQSATWVAHDLGRVVVALARNYADPAKEVLGKTYPVVTTSFTYPEFAAAIAKAIGKEVTFTSVESAGLVDLDEMFSFQAKIGMYITTPIPNPALVALGVEFGTMEEFIREEVVPRYA
ncbi:NAD(P)-binding protein [Mycena galericulata]|nr:NAD(P)-binding protein [Mycena galericulata]